MVCPTDTTVSPPVSKTARHCALCTGRRHVVTSRHRAWVMIACCRCNSVRGGDGAAVKRCSFVCQRVLTQQWQHGFYCWVTLTAVTVPARRHTAIFWLWIRTSTSRSRGQQRGAGEEDLHISHITGSCWPGPPIGVPHSVSTLLDYKRESALVRTRVSSQAYTRSRLTSCPQAHSSNTALKWT
jgi:hypothetical protein